MTLDCRCRTDRRTFLYVGRAIRLRNRLQRHAFGSVTASPSPWINAFQQDPHLHEVQCMVWYVEPPLLSVAEALLIDLLRPTHNIRDKGFGATGLWALRPEDAVIGVEEIEPVRGRNKGIAAHSNARNESAVYAWFIDPGMDLAAILDIGKEVFEKAPDQQAYQRAKEMVAERLGSAPK